MTVIIWCHWYKVMLKQKDELESHSSQLNRTLSLAPRAAYGPCWPQSSSRWVVRSAIKAWILCQHAAERVDIFGRVVIVSIGGRRLALTEETIQFPQGSRQRRKRAGGPLQLARMRGVRSELRDPFAWPNAGLRAGAAAR